MSGHSGEAFGQDRGHGGPDPAGTVCDDAGGGSVGRALRFPSQGAGPKKVGVSRKSVANCSKLGPKVQSLQDPNKGARPTALGA